MKLKEIYNRIDARYPKKYSDDYVAAYGGHDNSGILIDSGEEIRSAVFSLDFSAAAVGYAKEIGANLIVTHHPAVFFPIANFRAEDPLGARLLVAMREGIGVISMHLNCDCAKGGVDESLAEAIGATGDIRICEPIGEVGYGRVYEVAPQPFSSFCEGLKSRLGTQRAFVYGKGDSPVRKVASFCGAGADAAALRRAVEYGADTLVSADIKHNIICDACESGLKIVQLTHYASENFGFKKIYQDLCGELGVPSYYWEDSFLL